MHASQEMALAKTRAIDAAKAKAVAGATAPAVLPPFVHLKCGKEIWNTVRDVVVDGF